MEDLSSEEFIKAESKRIHQQIVGLVNQNGNPYYDSDILETKFFNKKDRKYIVNLYLLPTEDALVYFSEDIGKLLPEDFTYPISHFEEVNNTGHPLDILCSTPYGRLPTFVIGTDNKLYIFQNEYFFDADGRAKKYEYVAEVSGSPTLEDALGQSALQEDQTPRVDFIPNTDDSRMVDLESKDYDKVGAILQQIISGQFEAEASSNIET